MEISPADYGQQMLFQNSDLKYAHLFTVIDKLNKIFKGNKK